LALSTRLNWQFSVSFQVHIKSLSSYHICHIYQASVVSYQLLLDTTQNIMVLI